MNEKTREDKFNRMVEQLYTNRSFPGIGEIERGIEIKRVGLNSSPVQRHPGINAEIVALKEKLAAALAIKVAEWKAKNESFDCFKEEL